MNSYKRARVANFTFDEVNQLVCLVERHSKIIESKVTDMYSKREKEKIWDLLAEQFNALTSTARSAKSLKSRWEAIKKQTRAEYANIKRNNSATGGGPFKKPVISSVGERVLSVVGIGITGQENIFDSDQERIGPSAVDMQTKGILEPVGCTSLATEVQQLDVTAQIHSAEIKFVTENSHLQRQLVTPVDDLNHTEINSNEIFLDNKGIEWREWNPQSLRKPVTAVLQTETIAAETDENDVVAEPSTVRIPKKNQTNS